MHSAFEMLMFLQDLRLNICRDFDYLVNLSAGSGEQPLQFGSKLLFPKSGGKIFPPLKEYVSLLIGLCKNNGSVSHVAYHLHPGV